MDTLEASIRKSARTAVKDDMQDLRNEIKNIQYEIEFLKKRLVSNETDIERLWEHKVRADAQRLNTKANGEEM